MRPNSKGNAQSRHCDLAPEAKVAYRTIASDPILDPGIDSASGSPKMVEGYSRFQYGGYWFGFVEPWPEDWYYTDDVYVDYADGGYYLYNPYYPGVRVEIIVVL